MAISPSQPILEFVCDAIPLDMQTYEHSETRVEDYCHDEGYRTALLAVAQRAEELGLPSDTVLALMVGGVFHYQRILEHDRQ